jgi:uncharacterized protein (TIGR02300 family)
MPNPEWGTKRLCPTTGKRFCDLYRTPIVSPCTGEMLDIEALRRKGAGVIMAAEAKTSRLIEHDTDGDDLIEAAVADDADLDEERLKDDDQGTVSLDDLADIPGDEEPVVDAVPWSGVAGADRHRGSRRGPA